ncbi:hypothetical protein AGMMS49965_18260 [Bacteroidia bacterium]|nr:hypothetical protein AGMMS49965_18260 [Bacteroidia bacterium]
MKKKVLQGIVWKDIAGVDPKRICHCGLDPQSLKRNRIAWAYFWWVPISETKKFVRNVEAWVTESMKAGKITVEEGREFLSNYRSGLYGYTYLE